MSEPIRITGIAYAAPNGTSKDTRIVLTVENGDPLYLVVGFSEAEQIISGLGSALQILRMALSESGGWANVPLEAPQTVQVQKDQFSGNVLLIVTTLLALQYRFSLPPETALAIADQLKIAGSEGPPVGNA